MKTYTVSELVNILNKNIKKIGQFLVEGEISNLKYHSSQHIYFTIKDSNSQIPCVIFRSRRERILFKLEEGKKYVIYGNFDYWAGGGRIQIIVENVFPSGMGELTLKFEMLKKKLQEEGLFDDEHKLSLPEFPQRIGVVTSLEGAAVRDIISVIKKRAPGVEILIRPTLVQGKDAAQDIVEAIREFNEFDNVDVIIVGRGGGSLEDIWSFNEEIVARAIYNSKIPIISAVGHEIDFTISDFVSDVRAATPTAAAEIIVNLRSEMLKKIESIEMIIVNTVGNKIKEANSRVGFIERSYILRNPLLPIEKKRATLDYLEEKGTKELMKRIRHFKTVLERTKLPEPPIRYLKENLIEKERYIKRFVVDLLNKKGRVISSLAFQLNDLSPNNTLRRGYTIVKKESQIIKSSKRLKEKDKIDITFYDGDVGAEIIPK